MFKSLKIYSSSVQLGPLSFFQRDIPMQLLPGLGPKSFLWIIKITPLQMANMGQKFKMVIPPLATQLHLVQRHQAQTQGFQALFFFALLLPWVYFQPSACSQLGLRQLYIYINIYTGTPPQKVETQLRSIRRSKACTIASASVTIFWHTCHD